MIRSCYVHTLSACLLLLSFTALTTLLPSDAQAQIKTNFVAVGFSNDIKTGEDPVAFDDLLGVLEAHTVFDGSTQNVARFLLVTGVGVGNSDRVYEANVSVPVNFVPGKKPFIGLGEGPIASPWQAFEEPVLGFEEPVLGYEDPQADLQKIWGTGGVSIEEGFFGLVLFAMPDPSFSGNESAPIDYGAAIAIVPFKVGEGSQDRRVLDKPARRKEPMSFEVAAYPNPFNPTTTIRYALPEAAPMRLAVYDLLGREVALLVEGAQAAGAHEAVFEARGLPSGVYLYRIQAGHIVQTGRMTLMK